MVQVIAYTVGAACIALGTAALIAVAMQLAWYGLRAAVQMVQRTNTAGYVPNTPLPHHNAR